MVLRQTSKSKFYPQPQGHHQHGARAQARQDPYNGGEPPRPPPPSIYQHQGTTWLLPVVPHMAPLNKFYHIAIAYLNPPVSKTWFSLILIKQCNWRFIGSCTSFVDIPCLISINSVVFDCKWFCPIPPVTQSFDLLYNFRLHISHWFSLYSTLVV